MARRRGRIRGLGWRVIGIVAGRRRWQRLFQSVHRASLVGMNFGGVADHPSTSGEALVLRALPRGATVVDVGANVGAYATLALGVGARVHSFEPSASCLVTLRAVAGDACIHPYGLGDADRERELLTTKTADGLGSLYERHHRKLRWDRAETVRIRRLDDVCAEDGIERIDLLKLDVEGHELSVLRGAERMLAEDRIERIQFEFGGTALDSRIYLRDFFELLEPRFRLYRVVRDGLAPMKYDERWEIFTTVNYLAVHR